MGCCVVVGGQYGSEGKGKVVSLQTSLYAEPWVVRCGGPNSGHTASVDGVEVVLRQVPAGAGHRNSVLLLSAGCVIDERILLDEMERLHIPRERIIVDPRAVLVNDLDRQNEAEIVNSISSTGSGTGSALARRISRSGDVKLAAHSEELVHYAKVEPVAALLHAHLDRGGQVIIEGTQGFGLSLFHGPEYPFVTSRDTTASGFISEVGLSPRQVEQIILVIRTFPIRVGGNSGRLKNELRWEDVQRLSGAPIPFPEYTSVTHRLRRVGRFDMDLFSMACRYNRPTRLAIMGLDRIDFANFKITEASQLTENALNFVRAVELESGIPVAWVGTGFDTFDCIKMEGLSTTGPPLSEAVNA